MEVTQNSRPQLDGLPDVVLENIGYRLGNKDLKSMRLVSKQISKNIFYAYKKILFSDYAFCLLNESSLKVALKVAKDPDFGGAIRKLTILTDHFGFRCQPPSALSRTQQMIKQIIKEEEKEFHINGPILTSLTEIFSVLKPHGKITEIEITSMEAIGRQPADTQLLSGLVNKHKYIWTRKVNASATTSKVVEAIALSKIKLKAFKTHMCFGTYSPLDFDPKFCPEAFSNLETLSLSLDCVRSEDLVALLETMPCLSTFNLRLVGGLPIGFVTTQFSALKSLTILPLLPLEDDMGTIDSADLRNFAQLNSSLLSLSVELFWIENCSRFIEISESRVATEGDIGELQKFIGVPGEYSKIALAP